MANSLAHVAIAVNDLNQAKQLFEKIAGSSASEPHIVEDQKVNTSFIKIGGTSFELLEPTSADSPISNFLEKRGGGIHHVCIETNNFDRLMSDISAMGIRTLGQPSIGAKGKRIIFFHPKDTFNVLIELEEE